MTIFARIVNATTFHLDSDDVGGSVIMLATRLRIEIDATHVRMIWKHGANQEKRGRVTCQPNAKLGSLSGRERSDP
jgi:hypothetical protein